MTIEYLEKQLALYKLIMVGCIGSGLTLLATALADFPNHFAVSYVGWYGVWLILLLATIAPALALLVGSEFRRLPFADRLNPVFGFLLAAWFVLLGFSVKTANSGLTLWAPVLWFSGIAGAVLGISYWLVRRKYLNAPDLRFP